MTRRFNTTVMEYNQTVNAIKGKIIALPILFLAGVVKLILVLA